VTIEGQSMQDARTTDIGVKPGDVLAGKYRVERVLGAGGMGVVVAAQHLQLDERVALKFLLPDALANHDLLARFLREARAAAKIKSEHVARVTDVGQLESGSPYIVMEYLEGIDLAGWLTERGVLPIEQTVDFVLQACEALADAHALGIVHRDLKPANLFCVRRAHGETTVKVLDFGISKVTSDMAGQHKTRTSAPMGTPLYMSPEQMQNAKNVDARTDVWSLGCILFELLTGRVPFEAETLTELVLTVVHGTAPPVRALRSDVPEALEQIVARCLEKDRERRFPTVGKLAAALEPFGGKHAARSVERILATLRAAGQQSVAPPPPTSAPVTPRTATGATWTETLPGSRSSRRLAWALGGGGAALVLLGALALVALRPRAVAASSSSSPPPSAAPQTASSAITIEPVAVTAPLTAPPPSASVAAAAPPPKARALPPPPPPKPTASASGSVAAKNCTPPYVVDANGDRKYKPECL
jgi:serine/threonine-protein kinase